MVVNAAVVIIADMAAPLFKKSAEIPIYRPIYRESGGRR
jgi:hypothetical protein